MIPVHDVAPAALAAVLKEGALTNGKLQFAWRLAVGPAIDRVTQVSLAPDGAIVVAVPDQRWRTEIARSRDAIRSRLSALLGANAVKRFSIITSPHHRITKC